MPAGNHQVTVVLLNPKENYELNTNEYIIYGEHQSPVVDKTGVKK